MSISSLLFREQWDAIDRADDQPERPARSLRRMLKPWPLPPPEPTGPAYDDEDDPEVREPTPAVVLDRLAKFAART